MLKKFTLSLVFISALVIVYDANYNNAHTNGSGAPSGRTGSPGDGATCNTGSCHPSTQPTDQVATITSDVPVGGYVPGTTYSITATATKAGVTEFGFQLSPQNASGTKLGAFVTPLPAGMQFANPNTGMANKYVTHTGSGTAGTDTKTWTVQWTAPAAGTGTVTFYGAFNFTNSNNNTSGDVIKTTSLDINENTSIGIDETAEQGGFQVFPNPANDIVNVSFFLYEMSTVNAEIFDINGRLIKQTVAENLHPGRHELKFNAHGDMEAGVYFIRLNDGKNVYSKKVVMK
ncbi:MAG: hypothetical protein POELPBGB_01830 [Bacteroidia bacterium]|nr:hypothetical protein [Bacteroidia bacterium]